MKINAVIVDDEAPSRHNLQAILKDYFPEIHLAGMAEEMVSAYDLIMSSKPNLVFLDMELVDKTGFQLLELFEKPEFEVIFVTAYEDYAVKAYRSIAIDYILKPIDIDEIRDAILKVKNKLSSKEIEKAKDTEVAFNANIGNKGAYLNVSTSDGFEMISIDDILYLHSINFYTNIVLNNKREIITSRHLKDYEEQLRTFRFSGYIIHTS
ncbi:MAG: response regulator [Saprospiraceae bacterium]|nr:response regulator [Saprospiraceae bacterium]